MKRASLSILIFFFFVSIVNAGYRDLDAEYQKWRPSNRYRSFSQTAETSVAGAVSEKASVKKDWNRELRNWIEHAQGVPGSIRERRFPIINPEDTEAVRKLIAKRLDPDELAGLALLRNPGIRSLQEKLRAEMEKISQVEETEQVLREFTAFTEASMSGTGPMKGMDSIKMKYPFPGMTSLKGEVAFLDVAIAKETLAAAERNIASTARKLYWRFRFVDEAQAITSETLDLFRRLETAAATKYKSGRAGYSDVVRVRIQRAMLEEKLVTLKEERKNLVVKLFEVLHFDPDQAFHPGKPVSRNPEPITVSLEDLFIRTVESRQELRKMRLMIRKMEAMVEMGETMNGYLAPGDYSFFQDNAAMQVGSFAMKESFPSAASITRGSGTPKNPFFGEKDAYLRMTKRNVLSLKEKLRNMEASAKSMVRSAWFAMDRAYREKKLFETSVVPLSGAGVDVTNRAYESGRAAFADVVRSHSDWLKNRLKLAEIKRDLGIAGIELMAITGKTE